MGDTSPTMIAAFYSYFAQESNNGKVLSLDLSQRSDLGIRKEGGEQIILTDDEVAERTDWNNRKLQIAQHYRVATPRIPSELSQEEFLLLRVAAPCLKANSRLVSVRSPTTDYRASRHYPPSVQVWREFEQSVRNFRADNTVQSVTAFSILQVEGSLSDVAACVDEGSEQQYLAAKVLDPLQYAGLIGEVSIGSRNCQGEPDFSLRGPENEAIVLGESKATHNLPLPMTAQELATHYNEARAAVDGLTEPRSDRHQRPPGWSHVGHTISQILGYMVLNHCRYGVLTSGSRTYFIHMQRGNTIDEENVKISDAWYIGQENYLRAWAFFYASACDENQQDLNKDALSEAWLEGTPDNAKKRHPSPSEKGSSKRNFGIFRRGSYWGGGRKRASSNSLSRGKGNIPTVALSDFKVGQPIGYGRRGTTFSGTWKNGEVVALKLFDTHKNNGREAFEREIKAYEHLTEAWGRLVPTPKFYAEAFGVIYFGMQMAEQPSQCASFDDWNEVRCELEEKYGFRHLDLEGDERGPNFRNHMMLRDKSGKMQPIVIDLEEYELL